MGNRAALLLLLLLGLGVVQPAASATEDVYQWLEDVDGEKALQWVKARNEESVAALGRDAGFKQLNERLLRILDSKDKIPVVTKAGPHYYNFWRDEKNVRGLWRRTTLAEYRKPLPRWETVLDLDALAAQERENWVWKGYACLRPANQRCMLKLSRGGGDAVVLREFDLSSKAFVRDGFVVPEAKTNFAWKDQDTLLIASDFGPGSLTESGYPRLAKEWKRGTPLAEARLFFEGRPGDVTVEVERTTEPGYERELVTRAISFFSGEYFLRTAGGLVKIEVPEDVTQVFASREFLYVELRTPWTVGGRTYPAGSLVATDFERFLKGERNFDVLFQPTERKSLYSVAAFSGGVVLKELDNVRGRIYVLRHRDSRWQREAFPGLSTLDTVDISFPDYAHSDEYFLTVMGYTKPTALYRGVIGKGAPERLKRTPDFFDAKGLVVSQHEAVSKDGTRIPYFQVAKKGLKADGTAPTLLYGYGGFQISLTPGYRRVMGPAWLEKGGVYVEANIRGGGEFGPQWHQAAMRANRHRAYEDFAAVAEDLARRKITSAEHLGISGGSNGGLLVGNMLTSYPDRFRAVVCAVPLLDMQRYNKLLAGASWVEEYGNPDRPEDWQFLKTFSPYHNVRTGMRYPAVLFTTSTRDDRVHPGHARKMVAKMRDLGYAPLYYENTEGGHAGSADNRQAAFMAALEYTFLWRELK